jgi:hypothetical protein
MKWLIKMEAEIKTDMQTLIFADNMLISERTKRKLKAGSIEPYYKGIQTENEYEGKSTEIDRRIQNNSKC